MTDRDHRVLEYPARSRDAQGPSGEQGRRTGSGRRLLGLAALLVLVGGLAVGVWRHYALHLKVTAAAEQHRDFVPSARVEAVRASPGTMSVILPATTNAFQAADIFARASGYITERDVDIGSRVKAGDLLAAITARSSTTRSPRPKPAWLRPRHHAGKPRRTVNSPGSLGAATLFWRGKAGPLSSRATPIAWAMRLSSRQNWLMTPPSGHRRRSCWCCASRRPISRSSPRSTAS
jgi:hypothetical protein